MSRSESANVSADIFTYELPQERIAQRPVYPYDTAKLLVLEASGEIRQMTFRGLPELLTGNEVLVFNNSKVIPARLFGKLNQAAVEILLIREEHSNWVVWAKPLKKCKPGTLIAFGEGLSAKVMERVGLTELRVEFLKGSEIATQEEIFRQGIMPIPPYIRSGKADEQDVLDYQTVFAERSGSVAAPTASLHFTPELMESLKKRGCVLEYLTLHVGIASIAPVFRENELHRPPAEKFCFDAKLCERLLEYRAQGKPILAVGTTVVRALETYATLQNQIESKVTDASIFIRHPHRFQLVDGLITNFHQPGTTHLCLVEAFLGGSRELLARCYNYALENDFRFLSYGDGMFVRPKGS